MRGVALVFARSLCEPDRADVKVVSAVRGAPGTGADVTDALTWYHATFQKAGMANNTDGIDTLRHTYTLLIALGMEESSGEYCTGRDRSKGFAKADNAEAGLLQTSWGASKTNAALPPLFQHYQADQSGCLLDSFRDHITCKPWDARTWE